MQKPTVNGVVPVFRENSGNSLCNVSQRKRALRSLIRRKRLQLYLKLHTMAFVAHARPEAPKRLRQGESFDPAPRGKSDTHACSLNKGIGCKSRTRKESIAGLQSVHLRLQARGRIPKVAVILKYCFPCGESPRAVKTGHWKGCHGPERRLKQCVGSKARDRKRRSDAQPE